MYCGNLQNKRSCYYTAYDNHQITAMHMHKEELDGGALVRYPLIHREQIASQN